MSAATMSGDPTPIIAVLDIQATYSAREAAVLLGRSYSWLDQGLRQDQFIRPNGTTVQPLRTQGGCRRGRPPQDRRVRDPELSAFLWAARGGGQGSLASHPERLIRGLWDGGPQPEPERTIKTGARTLYRRGEPIGTSDWFQVCHKTFVSGMVDSDARVPGR
jgi:hypothetical protein